MLEISKERFEEYKIGLIEQVNDSFQTIIINSYEHPNPVEKMEKKLGEILLEILKDEN